MSDYDHIILSMELGDPITETANGFVRVAISYPHANLQISMHGFDDDPRELWQIPEAMDYFRRWYAHVVILSAGRRSLQRLDSVSKALILYSIGKATATLNADGITDFQTTGEL